MCRRSFEKQFALRFSQLEHTHTVFIMRRASSLASPGSAYTATEPRFHGRLLSTALLDGKCDVLLELDAENNAVERLSLVSTSSDTEPLKNLPPDALATFASSLKFLDLSGNALTKVDGVLALVGLRELSIARNRITKVDGIEVLQSLVNLDLSGNLLSSIPRKLSRLTSLESLNLSGNNILALKDVLVLKPLTSLIALSLNLNPLSASRRYRSFVAYHLPQVLAIDNDEVTEDGRAEAASVFGEASDPNSVANAEKLAQSVAVAAAARRQRALQEENRRLKGELEAQTQVLESAERERVAAEEHSSALQLELAFLKIDGNSGSGAGRSVSAMSPRSVTSSVVFSPRGGQQLSSPHEGSWWSQSGSSSRQPKRSSPPTPPAYPGSYRLYPSSLPPTPQSFTRSSSPRSALARSATSNHTPGGTFLYAKAAAAGRSSTGGASAKQLSSPWIPGNSDTARSPVDSRNVSPALIHVDMPRSPRGIHSSSSKSPPALPQSLDIANLKESSNMVHSNDTDGAFQQDTSRAARDDLAAHVNISKASNLEEKDPEIAKREEELKKALEDEGQAVATAQQCWAKLESQRKRLQSLRECLWGGLKQLEMAIGEVEDSGESHALIHAREEWSRDHLEETVTKLKNEENSLVDLRAAMAQDADGVPGAREGLKRLAAMRLESSEYNIALMHYEVRVGCCLSILLSTPPTHTLSSSTLTPAEAMAQGGRLTRFVGEPTAEFIPRLQHRIRQVLTLERAQAGGVAAMYREAKVLCDNAIGAEARRQALKQRDKERESLRGREWPLDDTISDLETQLHGPDAAGAGIIRTIDKDSNNPIVGDNNIINSGDRSSSKLRAEELMLGAEDEAELEKVIESLRQKWRITKNQSRTQQDTSAVNIDGQHTGADTLAVETTTRPGLPATPDTVEVFTPPQLSGSKRYAASSVSGPSGANTDLADTAAGKSLVSSSLHQPPDTACDEDDAELIDLKARRSVAFRRYTEARTNEVMDEARGVAVKRETGESLASLWINVVAGRHFPSLRRMTSSAETYVTLALDPPSSLFGPMSSVPPLPSEPRKTLTAKGLYPEWKEEIVLAPVSDRYNQRLLINLVDALTGVVVGEGSCPLSSYSTQTNQQEWISLRLPPTLTPRRAPPLPPDCAVLLTLRLSYSKVVKCEDVLARLESSISQRKAGLAAEKRRRSSSIAEQHTPELTGVVSNQRHKTGPVYHTVERRSHDQNSSFQHQQITSPPTNFRSLRGRGRRNSAFSVSSSQAAFTPIGSGHWKSGPSPSTNSVGGSSVGGFTFTGQNSLGTAKRVRPRSARMTPVPFYSGNSSSSPPKGRHPSATPNGAYVNSEVYSSNAHRVGVSNAAFSLGTVIRSPAQRWAATPESLARRDNRQQRRVTGASGSASSHDVYDSGGRWIGLTNRQVAFKTEMMKKFGSGQASPGQPWR